MIGTFIIAGCGRNHLGDPDKAKQLISAAKESGCDAVRFQTYITERFVSEDHPDYELMKQCELTYEQQTELKAYADSCGIEFLSTVFDQEGVFFILERLGLRRIKIGAPVGNPLFDVVNEYGVSIQSLHVLLSGASNWQLIDQTVNKQLVDVNNITVMHSVAGSPVSEDDVNLNAITTLRWALGSGRIGYTDFTGDILAPALAVVAGALVIEKNLTLDRASLCPDLKTSADPSEMAQMVGVIRLHEKMLGDGKISE